MSEMPMLAVTPISCHFVAGNLPPPSIGDVAYAEDDALFERCAAHFNEFPTAAGAHPHFKQAATVASRPIRGVTLRP
jgi:hypothetical protein